MTLYRQRILALIEPRLRALACTNALDFGCGDGWFARCLTDNGVLGNITALDVKQRPNSYVQPQLYDGHTIPFADAQFDLVYAIDVVHHTPDPHATLRDMMRVCGRYLLLKDHRFEGWLGQVALCALDEIGNRRFDIPSLYTYQRGWEWLDLIESSGFRRLHLQHPAPVHAGLMGRLTNPLQFIGLWEKVE